MPKGPVSRLSNEGIASCAERDLMFLTGQHDAGSPDTQRIQLFDVYLKGAPVSTLASRVAKRFRSCFSH